MRPPFGTLECFGDLVRGAREAKEKGLTLVRERREQRARCVGEERERRGLGRHHGRTDEDIHAFPHPLVVVAEDARGPEEPCRALVRSSALLRHPFDGAHRGCAIGGALGGSREQEKRRPLRRHGGEGLRGVLQRQVHVAALLEEPRRSVVCCAPSEATEGAVTDGVVER